MSNLNIFGRERAEDLEQYEDWDQEEESEEEWNGDIVYHECFPEEWKTADKPGTGPKECGNCRSYGSLDGIFLGYCTNCAQHEYKGQRGPGLYNNGMERPDFTDTSIYTTYLKGYTLCADGKSLVKTDDPPEKVVNDLHVRYLTKHRLQLIATADGAISYSSLPDTEKSEVA